MLLMNKKNIERNVAEIKVLSNARHSIVINEK